MSMPRYIVKRIGDRYELHRKDSHAKVASSLYLFGGGALILHGCVRRGFSGAAAIAIGGVAIYRGMTGRNLLSGLCRCKAEPLGDSRLAPSYQNDGLSKAPQLPLDEVEEASMESFPASDPPAHAKTSPKS